ncbi:structural maintenance of chromosomes protein 2-like [Patella vulgata]|uniref:structural maintenance of chromosomes protein 2-like n=1 Tax=Patella vulgata TaxID=6465 RepID=UPI0024A943F4|nr:structural maintenance of chromosomes protein 2-like [Patella vulgata]
MHRFVQLKKEYDLKKQEANQINAKLEQTKHHEQLTVIKNLLTAIDEQENNLKNAEKKQKNATDKVKELENKLKNAKSVREKELKQAEDTLNKAKKNMEESAKKMKEKLQEVDSVKLETEELQKEICNYECQLETCYINIFELEGEILELQKDGDNQKSAVLQAQEAVNKQKLLLRAKNKEIGEKVAEQRTCQKEIKTTKLEMQDLDHKITKHQKDFRDAIKLVENLLQEYEWITEEKKFFGQPNTGYDFKVHDPKEAGRRISRLTETKEKLSKNVNMRAMNMLGKAEEQYNDLIRKRQIVLNDKSKIALVIVELDEKKNNALKKAWTQVNKDFNSIFSSLLPGTQAKLSPPDSKTVLDGLEVKVAFGDVWKESLSELSGGQRSLVALSLILSLLLFKPAPIYILDEVDAALDLSHTQNIGQMIKSHFQHSQFIVVSLKDGMFTNANILFKTKFVDGVSTVSRHIQQTMKPTTNASLHTEEEITVKRRKEAL